ncbi:MAG: GIY-YIG nuclease family protein [Bacteroidales bacterium]
MAVYILECSDGSYYTGVTNNIERRLIEHESGYVQSCYTFTRRPLKLVFYEFFQTPADAIRWEKRIKGWSRNKKKALIEGNWEKLQEFARCNNKTSHKYNKK